MLCRHARASEFDRRVAEALTLLVAGDTAGSAAFDPAVRAVTGWKHGGTLVRRGACNPLVHNVGHIAWGLPCPISELSPPV